MTTHLVAGLFFSMDDELRLLAEHNNYSPFRTEKTINKSEYLFHVETGSYIEVEPETNSNLTAYSNENGSYSVHYSNGRYYWKLTRTGDERCYGMLLDLNDKKAILNFKVEDERAILAANDFLRFAFIYTAAFHQTIILHASCIAYQGDGIVFTGHSGVGKSTHSSLWLKYIEGAELLNDDQPAVKIENNKIIIFGTPWSGKTDCYKQMNAELKAIVCLQQAPENKLTDISTMTLFSHLLPECSLMKTDKATMPMLINTLAKIAEKVKGSILENRPEKDAVQLSYEFLTHNKS